MIDVRHVDKHTYVNVAPSRGMMTVPDDRHTVCCRPHIHFSRHDDGKRCLEYGMMTLYVNVFESTKCSYTKQKPVVLILPPEERNFFHLGGSDISKKNFFFQTLQKICVGPTFQTQFFFSFSGLSAVAPSCLAALSVQQLYGRASTWTWLGAGTIFF